jgi:hypothetical protein
MYAIENSAVKGHKAIEYKFVKAFLTEDKEPEGESDECY